MNTKVLASLSLALLATSLLGAAQPADAKPWNHSVNQRQQRQQNRIRHGIGNGELTRREAGRLSYQQKALKKQEAFYRSTGNGLSANERARLQHQQNQLSQNIYNQKHDGQERGDGRPGNQLYDINKTQNNQDQRIYNGISSGELTRKEAARLDNQQDRFDAREAQMRQGGLTLEERRRLDNHQDRLSREIYQQKHDGQDRN